MSFKVVLTGGIASGKTAVSNFFSELNVDVIDADIVAREVVAPETPGLESIRNYFGSEVILSDGSLNRGLLRSIVFEDEQEREWLNGLLHPLIRKRMESLQTQSKSSYSLSVIPLLFESKQYQLYDRVLVVDCAVEQQLARLMARDNSSKAQALAILNSQASRAERLSIADDVIENSKDLHYLQHQVINLHNKYLSIAKN
ncbi:dephospho-CoA kinase [Kangiella sp. HZ709]|uniref:dephospho-CoA kinase n=1 Tax=Kangiella sp. HZ709 TaxID=2666328 RepID=UPI0012AF2B54|nr:dephospho-CoA kinase [Kangiella sp. HZ709]MRX27409.1 dephospho-CoA kinase [Kangiella sp. HZ709]